VDVKRNGVAERVEVSGAVVNRGDGDFFQPKVIASLLDEDGEIAFMQEASGVLTSSPIELKYNTQKTKERYSFLRLRENLTKWNQLLFKASFSAVKTGAARIELRFVGSPGGAGNRSKKVVSYLLPIHVQKTTINTRQYRLFGGKKLLWHVLRFGMSLAQVKNALMNQKYIAAESGVTKQPNETALVKIYQSNGGGMKFFFHEGKLFSYRFKLPASIKRSDRENVLNVLSGLFDGRVVSSGGDYFVSDDVNSEEFYGRERQGIQVETQGDWLLVYEESMLTEVQRLEQLGR
jgi:hypothetical protein